MHLSTKWQRVIQNIAGRLWILLRRFGIVKARVVDNDREGASRE
jgi:hypothetical protein